MEFGLFVLCHRFDDRISVAELYDQALETVRLADDAGFHHGVVPGAPPGEGARVRAARRRSVHPVRAFGPDHAGTMASLRRFAEDVMPHFAKGSRA